MTPSISSSAAEKLRDIIDKNTKEEATKVPGATICIVGRDGKPIFTHASGKTTRNEKPEETRNVKLDDLIRAFSTGKLLVVICLLQLVEEGTIELDSADYLEKYLPEFKSKQIVTSYSTSESGEKQPVFKDRQNRVTIRMLLNHSSQISNGMVDDDYEAYKAWYESKHPADPNDGAYADFRSGMGMYHFHDEPGSGFRYSGGLEWTGWLLERVTNLSLATLFKQRVIEPLQMTDTKVIHWCEAVPDVSRLLPGHMRLPDGSIFTQVTPPGHGYTTAPAVPDFKPFPESDKHAYAVSMSVLTNVLDYSKILAALLNGGVSPTTGARILMQASVDAMSTPQLTPEQLTNRLATDRTMLSIPLDLARLDPQGNIGLGCAVQGEERKMPDGKRGRSKGSAYWHGLANTDWWLDQEKGIAVVATTQILPWNDASWVEMMDSVEGVIYEGLEA